MDEEAFELLGAFLDGDRADPDQVAALLAREEGQSALLDFAILKAAIRQDDARPRPEFVAATERRLSAAGVIWRRVFTARHVAAAAVVLAATVGAYWIGTLGAARGSLESDPPVSTRVVHFERGVDWTPPRAMEGR